MTNPYPPLQPLAEVASRQMRQSYAQRRLWFLDQMGPEQGQHNILVRLSLTGPLLDATKLASAFTQLAQRHSVLRTRYRNTPEGPEQWIAAEPDVKLQVRDLRELSPEQQQQALEQFLRIEQHTPFDLTRGPVLRAFLWMLAADRQALIYTIHHIAFDGRSNEIFLAELAQLYAARVPDALPPAPIQYVDFAAWEPAYITPELVESEVGFWRDYLAGTPVQLEFMGRARQSGPARPARHRFVIDQALVDRLQATAKGKGQTLFTALVTLFGLWVQYLSGQNRFLIGTDVHGRDLPELADIMGFFVNQLTLKCDLSGDLTLAELLQRTQTLTRTALSHRQLPFDILVSALAPQRQPNRAPFFQVKLNYQRNRFLIDGIGEARIARTQVNQDLAGFDLVLDLMHGNEGINACMEYDQQLFSAQEIERFAPLWLDLAARFETLLELPLSQLRQEFHRWENTHLQAQQQAHNRQNRARLFSAARKPQPLEDQEDTLTTDLTSGRRPMSGAMRRKAVTVSEQALVQERLLDPGGGLPWMVEPAVAGMDLIQWARQHRDYLEQKVLQHGAVLFRNFGIASLDQFNEVISALSPGALEYMFRASPRTRVGGNIYTSTDYPADQMIFPHNEHSYSPRFPLRLFFYCHLPSATGGETPIGSTRKVMERIRPEIREKFREKKILYVRNYGDGFGLPWQTVFQTEDRAEVEAYCASVGIEVEWKKSWEAGPREAGTYRLRTRQIGPAIVRHPRTGEEVWFNHGTFFHVSTLPAAIRDSLNANFAADELPTNTFYGDGSAIEPEVLEELRAAYLQSLVRFPWQQGDILFIDNILAVHGREPFTGQRKILTGMAEALLGKDIQL